LIKVTLLLCLYTAASARGAFDVQCVCIPKHERRAYMCGKHVSLYLYTKLMIISAASVLAGRAAGSFVTYLGSLEALDLRVSCRCKLYTHGQSSLSNGLSGEGVAKCCADLESMEALDGMCKPEGYDGIVLS